MTCSEAQSIQQAIQYLKQGKLVAIPTETVYGLAADAKNQEAVAKIYTVKGRPKTNPLIIHLSDHSAINGFACNIPKAALQLADSFWPGPLTLILERHPEVPKIVTAGQNTVALRIPNHPLTLSLLREFGGGVAAPSANHYGRVSPTTAQHVRDELGRQVDYILDGGPCEIGIESTIVSLIAKDPIILREGAITAEQISEILGQKIQNGHDSKNEIRAPGASLSHYAPSKPLLLLDKEALLNQARILAEQKQPVSVLTFNPCPDFFNQAQGLWIQAFPNSQDYARDLYANLRRMDASMAEWLLVETPPHSKDWLAVLDRLSRAAFKKIL